MWTLHGFSEGMTGWVSYVGDCLVEASALDIIMVNGHGGSAWLPTAAQRWEEEANCYCTFAQGHAFLLCTATATQQTLMEVHN